MPNSHKHSKKEMTVGEVCRTILKESRDVILDYIYSITENHKK